MLQAKNLHKTYTTKAGVSQKALDDVSVNLDSTGLVFILGKSGSGKSTLLNILGGLDKMDAGEIIIKGKSSREFKTEDFDSYRNTYLGFIFQDFNILGDFTVAENINLAYELQHKKADEKRLNEILKQVELLEYKDRKPNELSGGQVQRVAIARALIKHPEIIMADEPTGSLDSETGKQVFKTLKELAKEKLILVVSHDRDSAETYADRIIELKDGKIIRDVTKETKIEKLSENTNIKLQDNKVIIKQGVTLTKTDIEMLNKVIQQEKTQIEVTSIEDRDKFDNLENNYFIETEKAVKKAQKEFAPFKLIKSKLPNYNAFKMGKSSLKHKKVKLFFTLFLTIIALTMFGFADIMGTFNVGKASANTFSGTTYSLLPFQKQLYHPTYSYYDTIQPNNADKLAFENLTGKDAYYGYELPNNMGYLLKNTIPSYNRYYTSTLNGIIEFPNAEAIKDELVGRFPENSNEVVINNYIFEHMKQFGFKHFNETTLQYEYLENITSFSEVENKIIGLYAGAWKTFTIVGMVNYDLTRYEKIKADWAKMNENSTWEEQNAIQSMHTDQYHFLARLIVKEGFYEDNYVANFKKSSFRPYGYSTGQTRYDIYYELTNLTPPSYMTGEVEIYNYLNKKYNEINRLENYQEIDLNNPSYFYFGSEVAAPTVLNDNEIIVPASWYTPYDILNEIDNGYGQTTYQWGFDTTKLMPYLNTTITLKVMAQSNFEEIAQIKSEKTYTIVGFLTARNASNFYRAQETVIVPNALFDEMVTHTSKVDVMYTYLNNNASDAKLFLTMDKHNFQHRTDLSEEIYTISDMFSIMQQVFFYMSLIMGVFVAFMILNFISTSISYKKKEIGILRALGARKLDVFKVFYFEGLIMGIINYIVTMALIVTGVIIFNGFVQDKLNTQVIVTGITLRPFIVVALVCFGVIFISSLLPVNKIASKKPIDAIRNH